ncbi:histidine kinase [Actinomyces viscosus]|nr:histidine kinase [Actinomyces viscosus]
MPSPLPTSQPGRTATSMPEDDDPELRPEPRGLLRAISQWCHGHPMVADALIALGTLAFSILMGITVLFRHDSPVSAYPILPPALSSLTLAGAALALRRRFPVWTWAVILFIPEIYQFGVIWTFDLTEEQLLYAASGVSGMSLLAVPITLGTIASHRKPAVAWTAGAVSLVTLALDVILTSNLTLEQFLRNAALLILLLSVGILVGLNTRSARLRLKTLEAHSARMALASEQATLLAAAEERSRIAREMHDVVAHSLAVMITMADGAAATVERNPATAKQAMETLAEAGRNALADTRRLVGVLREDPSVASSSASAPAGSTSSASSSGSGRTATSPDRVPPAPPTTPAASITSEVPMASGRPPTAARHLRWNLRRKAASPELSIPSASSAPSARSHEVRDVPVPEFAPLGTVAPVEPSAPIASLRRQATDAGSDRSQGDLPLAPAPEQADITGLVKRFEAAGVPVSYRWVGTALPADKALQLTVFRIAQEALTNVLRYAPTTPAVSVDVERHIGTVVLTVDNETAPDTRPVHGSGKGLIGMRERASVYGGTVQAGPTPTGWRVRAVLRWDEHDEGTSSWHTPL